MRGGTEEGRAVRGHVTEAQVEKSHEVSNTATSVEILSRILRDVTIAEVTGSAVVEQERKQEVNAATPQVALGRAAYPFGVCLRVRDGPSDVTAAAEWT